MSATQTHSSTRWISRPTPQNPPAAPMSPAHSLEIGAVVAETAGMDQPERAPRKHPVSGKVLFLATFAIAIVLSGGAFITGVVVSSAAVGAALVATALWALWFLALLYLAGGAISRLQHPGEAATSIVLAVLLTPVVLATPVAAVAGPAVASLREAFGGGAEGAGSTLDGTDVLPLLDPEEAAPVVVPSEEEAGLYYLPDGVTRADLTDEEWASFFECVTTGGTPDECPVGDDGN